MRTRRLIWLLPTLLALVGTPGSALAQTHRLPNPNPLWRVYPLGTQPLGKSTARGSARGGQHSKPSPRSAPQNTFRVGFAQILVATAVLCTFAAVIPIAVQRRRSSLRRSAATVNRRRGSPPRDDPTTSVEKGAAEARRRQVPRAAGSPSASSQRAALTDRRPNAGHALASPGRRLLLAEEDLRSADSPATSREESIDADLPATPDVVEARPARSTRPTARPDEMILRYAAAYADASGRGAPVPMAAVRAIVSPLTQDRAGYAKRMIAEARRRDLLTSHGRGRAGGELTPKALELMNRSTANRTHPAQSRGEGDEGR
jgi:hypothetical protein